MTTAEHSTTEQTVSDVVHEDSVQSDQRRRRLPSSRGALTRMFITVTVLAVLIVGFVNFLGARSIFSAAIEDQLASLASDRAETVRNTLDRVKADATVLAHDLSIATAAVELTQTFLELDGSSDALQPSEENALEEFYASGLQTFDASGSSDGVTADDLVPQGVSARYLQYHYIVDNPFEPDQRQDLVDAEDGSAFSAAHARYHPMLAARARSMGATDLLLTGVAADDSIVYSVAKRVDFGTSLLSGPYSGTSLGVAIADQLASVPVGQAILVDFDAYLPAGNHPTMFAAAAIRDQTQIVGAVIVALPKDLLDGVMTFDAGWEDVGFGEDGEAYLVGPDRLMRSISRFWVEDSETYLETIGALGYPADIAERIVHNDSTVLAQPVDTDAVAAGLAGETFSGDDTNYLDAKTFAFAEPLQMPGLDWVVVAEIAASESRSLVLDYLWSLLILALITIPVAAAVAYFMARRLTGPVDPLTSSAESIAAGDVDTAVPDLGRNEYGDLGNRINTVSAEIRERDAQREEEDRAITQVLLAALPPRLVEKARLAIEDGTINSTSDFGDLLDSCTVIAVSVSGYFDLTVSDMESTVDVSSAFAREVEELAAETSIERVRSTPDEYVFTSGLRTPGYAAPDALEFVQKLRDLLDQLQSETNRTGEYRIGMSAGHVSTGVLRGSELSFGIWGPAVRRAMSLVAAADAYQVLMDGTVEDELSDEWVVESVELVDLQDDRINAFSLPRQQVT